MSGLGLGLGLGLGAHRKGDRYGNMPATFTVTAGDGTKFVRVQVSETTTVTPAGGTSIRIGSSGDFVTTPLTLVANTNQDIYFNGAGSLTIPRRKLVTYLFLSSLGSSIITGDITGMKLTYLYLDSLVSSVITGDITGMELTFLRLANLGSSVAIIGDITGMKLTYLCLYNIGSSVITGDITGMKLTYLYLDSLVSSVITGDITGMELTFLRLANLGSSVAIIGDITGMKLTILYLYDLGSSSVAITGDITGMELTILYLYNIGSSLTYGTNLLNITNNLGVQLLGNTVFSASEYIQLFADAATCVTDGKWTASTKVMTISGGDNPGWSNVEGYYDIIVGGGVTVKVPLAWESGEDPFPPETPNP
jgi:hypothetical protein